MHPVTNKLEETRILYLNSDKTAAEVCRSMRVVRRTLFSYMAKMRTKEPAASNH